MPGSNFREGRALSAGVYGSPRFVVRPAAELGGLGVGNLRRRAAIRAMTAAERLVGRAASRSGPAEGVWRMKFSKSAAFLVVTGLVVACGSDPKPPPAGPTGPTEAPPAPLATSPEKPDDDATRGQINISDEIRKACGITDADAYFDFDSANVQSGAREVLTKLAKCFTDGPLKGRKMNLVGHADPRGEEEYNMVLGGRRADNVKHFLVSVSLPDAQAATTSRGEMDATGSDDAGWAKDRRVDVVLAQ